MFPHVKSSGMTISNWEIMEKLKAMISPNTFTILKVIKMVKSDNINPKIIKKLSQPLINQCYKDIPSDNEFLYLEAELEDSVNALKIVDILNGKLNNLHLPKLDINKYNNSKNSNYSFIKLSGVNIPLKVRAAYHNKKNSICDVDICKDINVDNHLLINSSFSHQSFYYDDISHIRNNWISHFKWDQKSSKDNPNSFRRLFFNSKPGHRPDTVLLKGLPTKWFIPKITLNHEFLKLLEPEIKKTFSIFGPVRDVFIPFNNDPFQLNTFSFSTSNFHTAYISNCTLDNSKNQNDNVIIPLTFDVFVQYNEYDSFERAMDGLVGSKLLYTPSPTENSLHDSGKIKFYTSIFQCDFDRNKHLSDLSISKRKNEAKLLIEKDSLNLIVNSDEIENVIDEKQSIPIVMPSNRSPQKFEENYIDKPHSKISSLSPFVNDKDSSKNAIINSPKPKSKHSHQHKKEKYKKYKVLMEERKLLLSQRKLESIRLLNSLFSAINDKLEEKEMEEQLEAKRKERERIKRIQKKQIKEAKTREFLILEELNLRKKLVHKLSKQTAKDIDLLCKNK
ncbi:A-kinase anchor protein 17A-like [Gordionus sp. m RMFG-2023]|uniref:A-kinase anchor protein 17A-like n=1 Tax=Gordionus sp. m RMFG-2023 TaxID=3053472 RepID=UPI0031FCDB7A